MAAVSSTSRREWDEFLNRNVLAALSFQACTSDTKLSSRVKGSNVTGILLALDTSSERVARTGIRPPTCRKNMFKLEYFRQKGEIYPTTWLILQSQIKMWIGPEEHLLLLSTPWPCWHTLWAVDNWVGMLGCHPLPVWLPQESQCYDEVWNEEILCLFSSKRLLLCFKPAKTNKPNIPKCWE